MHYLPLGDESSPRGVWGFCTLACPEALTGMKVFAVIQSKERNYEPSIILGYVFLIGLRESGNS
jgi:hypothetical protein